MQTWGLLVRLGCCDGQVWTTSDSPGSSEGFCGLQMGCHFTSLMPGSKMHPFFAPKERWRLSPLNGLSFQKGECKWQDTKWVAPACGVRMDGEQIQKPPFHVKSSEARETQQDDLGCT